MLLAVWTTFMNSYDGELHKKGGLCGHRLDRSSCILKPKCSPADFGNGNPLRTMDVKELRMPGRIFRRDCHGMAGLCF